MFDCISAITSGLCKADCCGCFQMNNDLIDRFKSLFQSEGKRFPITENQTAIITDDLHCVFLNRSDLRCTIYDSRPDVCRKYGMIEQLPCPVFDMDGVKRNRAGRRQTHRAISKDFDLFMRRTKVMGKS